MFMYRLRSAEKVTPSTRTWSNAVAVSESICNGRPLLPNDAMADVEPTSVGTYEPTNIYITPVLASLLFLNLHIGSK